MRIKESKGLSLIEMMIVVLLIGIMATISSYAYSRYVNNSNLRSWARQLGTDITAMKAKAALRADRIYNISFSTTNNSY
jgi:prepilin-type N-terminal cleavage/methylation domain-containing protein